MSLSFRSLPASLICATPAMRPGNFEPPSRPALPRPARLQKEKCDDDASPRLGTALDGQQMGPAADRSRSEKMAGAGLAGFPHRDAAEPRLWSDHFRDLDWSR